MSTVPMPDPPEGHYWEVGDSPSRRYLLVALMRELSVLRFRPTSQVACKCAEWSEDPDTNADTAARLAREILENLASRKESSADSRLGGLSGYVDQKGRAR